MVKIIAHRGFGKGPLENTLYAVHKAINLGVDGIEIDVQGTRDGEIIVFHDFVVGNKTSGRKAVADLTLVELQRLNPAEGQMIPTLQELIVLVEKVPGFLVNIEIKPENIEEPVLTLVRTGGIKDQVVISSYLESVLRKVRELDSSIQTALIYKTPLNDPIQIARSLDCSILAPQFGLISQDFVNQCKLGGVTIYPWPVNKKEDMERMIVWGVDGIITDKPQRLLQFVKHLDKSATMD